MSAPNDPSRADAARQAATAAGLVAAPDEGVPGSSPEYRFDVEHTVGLLAATLAALHTAPLPRPAEPLDPDELVELARDALAAGRLHVEAVSAAYRHVEPARLVEILAAGRATSLSGAGETPVATHGRPTLDALRCRDGAALGFAGWDRAAVADRYRDLAVAASSVATDLGPMLVPTLFERYAAAVHDDRYDHPDPLRLDWYALAAELTP